MNISFTKHTKMCNNNLAMPVIYCQTCAAKNTYSGKKPDSCSKCKTPFSAFTQASGVSVKPPLVVSKPALKPTPKPVDPRQERRLALLAERRGVKLPISEPDEDEDYDEDDEEFFDIHKPRKLKVQIEANNGSVGSIGSLLKSENPESFKDL